MPDTIELATQIHRAWGTINEQLVRRGELLMALSWLASWGSELEAMNSGKRGRPYRYPRSLVRFIRFLRDVWHLPLRQAEGMLRELLSLFGLKAPDYTTLWLRLVREDGEPLVPPRAGEHTLIIDSTGISVTMRGEWIRHKYRLRRGFLKAHVAVDLATRSVVSIIVTDERRGDAKLLVPLVEQASRILPGRIVRVLADGAYDSRENFDLLAKRGIDAVIRMRKNANMKRRGGTAARPLAVKERNALGEEAWRKKHHYGQRWIVEVVFSAIKRLLGEALRSRRSDLMLREAQHKFVQYSRLVFA